MNLLEPEETDNPQVKLLELAMRATEETASDRSPEEFARLFAFYRDAFVQQPAPPGAWARGVGRVARGVLMGLGALTLATLYLLRGKGRQAEPARSQQICRPPLAEIPKRPAA